MKKQQNIKIFTDRIKFEKELDKICVKLGGLILAHKSVPNSAFLSYTYNENGENYTIEYREKEKGKVV